MISNKMIVDGMKEALTTAFTTWLNENKEAIRAMVSSSMTAKANTDENPKQSKPRPKMYFTPNELAERWSFHPVSVLRLLRSGSLPTVRIGRRVLVSVADVEGYERDATLNRRIRRAANSASNPNC
jgi:excisionase family DNA binding protein